MAITNTQLVNYARGQLGRGYWYGTYGQRASEQVYKQILAMYPDKVGKWPKYTYVEQYGQKVHDCAGLIKGAVWCNGEIEAVPKYDSKTDRSANGLIDCCVATGNADTVPNIPGLIMWKPGHVGIWTAKDGITIEAKGHMYGVVETKNTAWQLWGKLPKDYVIYEDTPTPGYEIDLKVQALKYEGGAAMKDPNVFVFQSVMNSLEIRDDAGHELTEDSKYGPRCVEACKRYQRKVGLHDDGICGEKTWHKIFNS